MNFFGHAVAAAWVDDAPAFGLGAMLPDFASMSRGRIDGVDDGDLERGIEWHHRTDRAFHRLDAFRELVSDASSRLAARGLRRGAALGGAHVAVELALDGLLLDDPAGAELYTQALEAGRTALAGAIRWRAGDQAGRFESMLETLAGHGIPVGYRDPQIIAERTERVLSRRPRLALIESERPALTSEVTLMLLRVREALPGIMPPLRRALVAS